MDAVEMELILVRPDSNVQKVAGSIARAFDNVDSVEVRAVGAGAVNQAAKSVAISRGIIAPRGRDVWCRIGFTNVPSMSGEGTISAVVFYLECQ
jgi:stage V sporulation protein S